MNIDTVAIIVAMLGVGLALWRAIDSRHRDTDQDTAELRQEMRADFEALNFRINALHSRVDGLYQVLFSRSDTATGPKPSTAPGTGPRGL